MLQLDFAALKPVTAEGSIEAAVSPAAGYFGNSKAHGKVEQGGEGFAGTLEKAQERTASKTPTVPERWIRNPGKNPRPPLPKLQKPSRRLWVDWMNGS